MSSLQKSARCESAGLTSALCVAAASVFLAACSGTGGPPAGGAWDDSRNSVDLAILALISREEFGRVLEVADSLEASGVEDARLAGQKALALGMLGREEEATALFEKTIREDYESCENHLNFAVMLMKTGKTGRALTEFGEAGRFCDESRQPLIRRNLAVASLKMGREGEALGRVEEGLSQDPGDPYLLGLKGMLVASADPAQAESLFARSARRGPMSDDFLYQLGILFLKTGRPSAALMPLETISTRRPGDVEAALNYSEALIGSGRHGEAEERLRALIAAGGGEEASEKLARVLFRTGRFEEALEIYAALPATPENLDRVAMCHHNAGRSAEALAIQRGVVRERPEWAVGHVNLAAILAALGEVEEARSHLQKALELEPDNAAAKLNLGILERALEGNKP